MILVCHVGPLDPRVIEALPSDQPVRIVDIDRNDSTGYARHLELAWAFCVNAKDDLVVVEHDIVVHEDVFPTFSACESPACGFFYWMGASYEIGLGCSRFRSSLVCAVPDLMSRAAAMDDDLLPPSDWRRMDTRVWRVAYLEDVLPCRHMPPVTHLHNYPNPEPTLIRVAPDEED